MEIERSFTIAAAPDHVWDILGKRFHEVATWASSIDTSSALDNASRSSGVNDRMCKTAQGVFKEKVTLFDEERRTLAYAVYEGLPGFVREGGNTWWITSLAPRHTEVRFRMKFELSPIANFFMGWMLKRQMGRVADEVATDLKIYAETGTVSTTKSAALAKRAKKRAA
ncbi:MAG: SRPBCC family protein [Myxococcota bacterium]